VLFTGSKFYSGPPFSGALFLPEALAGDPGPLPKGLEAWLSAAELPTDWPQARASLSAANNPGLQLRWAAALAEIEAYHSVAPRQRGPCYHSFAGAVFEAFGPSSTIEVDMPMPPVHQLVTALGAYPSVFGFIVMGPDGPLDAAQLKCLHKLLDTDLADIAPELTGCYHLGQPVKLGPTGTSERALLRVALGASLITDLKDHPDHGAAWFRRHLGGLRSKIDTLIQRRMHLQ
jgi:hypothetical protein